MLNVFKIDVRPDFQATEYRTAFRMADGTCPIELAHEGWSNPAPNKLRLVAPDGTERTLAVVDADIIDRLQFAAERWCDELKTRFRDGDEATLERAGLEPGDLDPLP